MPILVPVKHHAVVTYVDRMATEKLRFLAIKLHAMHVTLKHMHLEQIQTES